MEESQSKVSGLGRLGFFFFFCFIHTNTYPENSERGWEEGGGSVVQRLPKAKGGGPGSVPKRKKGSWLQSTSIHFVGILCSRLVPYTTTFLPIALLNFAGSVLPQTLPFVFFSHLWLETHSHIHHSVRLNGEKKARRK